MNQESKILLLNNQVYDFNTGSVRNRNDKEYFEDSIQVNYDPNAKSELFDKFIDDFTLGKQDVKDCIQEFFGMSLTGDKMIMKKILYLYGENSGKTVLLNTIQKLIGTFAISISNNLNDYDYLYNKNLVVLNDDDERFNKSLLKKLVGGDLIYSKKFNFSFALSCRVVIISNTKDDFNGDKAMIQRCIYVPCLMEPVLNPTEKHQRLIDPNLYDKLNTPETLSAILNWLIEGGLRFKQNGYITEPL